MYEISEIEGIGEKYASKLQAVAIKSTEDLLKLCCHAKGRSEIAAKTGISETHLLKWANMADLMRVNGVGKQYAELLESAGVDTIKELRTRNAQNLADAMKTTNEAKKLARTTPSLTQIQSWITQAKGMDPTITH